jgi:predicted RNA-binding Zn-ribbon protein involved in translation (DUF1610 family)
MSVPSLKTVVANLRAEGHNELADRILKEAAKFKCPECSTLTANPGIALVDEQSEGPLAGKLIFYCPWCSDEKVRPDSVPK